MATFRSNGRVILDSDIIVEELSSSLPRHHIPLPVSEDGIRMTAGRKAPFVSNDAGLAVFVYHR